MAVDCDATMPDASKVSRMHPPSRPSGAAAVPLTLRATSLGTDAVLTVEGEVDIHTAASLRRRLLELIDGGHDRVIVDMTGVEFMDSSGLNVLVGAMRAGRRVGATMRVVATSRHLQQLFVVTGIDRVLPLYPTLAAAAAP